MADKTANRRTMERYTSEFLTTGDVALAEEFVSQDIVMYYPGQPELRGLDTLLASSPRTATRSPTSCGWVEQMTADGDTVAVRYSMTGTHRGSFAGIQPTGAAVVSQSMAFYRLNDGKIVEERAQLDMLGILQQLGAAPSA
ncbi:MAG: ester cyclase [Actinomycetota bacterium]